MVTRAGFSGEAGLLDFFVWKFVIFKILPNIFLGFLFFFFFLSPNNLAKARFSLLTIRKKVAVSITVDSGHPIWRTDTVFFGDIKDTRQTPW